MQGLGPVRQVPGPSRGSPRRVERGVWQSAAEGRQRQHQRPQRAAEPCAMQWWPCALCQVGRGHRQRPRVPFQGPCECVPMGVGDSHPTRTAHVAHRERTCRLACPSPVRFIDRSTATAAYVLFPPLFSFPLPFTSEGVIGFGLSA